MKSIFFFKKHNMSWFSGLSGIIGQLGQITSAVRLTPDEVKRNLMTIGNSTSKDDRISSLSELIESSDQYHKAIGEAIDIIMSAIRETKEDSSLQRLSLRLASEVVTPTNVIFFY
jgi:hypothetical protein